MHPVMTVDTVIWHESMDLAQTCCVALFWSQTHENHTTGTPEPTGGNTDDKYVMIESMRPFYFWKFLPCFGTLFSNSHVISE